MNEQESQHLIREKVLERIRAGRVRMRPRVYFVARVAATAAVALTTLILSAFVVSFIIFSIHESGEQFLLGFGGRGITTFLALFPWLPLLLDFALMLFLEWLVQGFRFGYRVSLVTIFLIIFAASGIPGIIISLTPLHSALLEQADRGTLPVIGALYEAINDSHADQGVFRGTVQSVGDGEITIMHDDNDADDDDVPHTVILPPDAPQYFPGDRVYIYGDADGDTIQARGVQAFPTDVR